MDWSKSEKEYVKAVYCHPAYLTSMQSTSCEMLWLVVAMRSGKQTHSEGQGR